MRPQTTAVANAAASPQVTLAVLVRLDFLSGVVTVNSTPYAMTHLGETYTGVGSLGSISAIEESGDIKATGMTLQLSGVDPALIALALGDKYQGRDAKIYLAFLDNDSHSVIPDPMLIYRGRMDTMDITLADKGVITVHVENRLADWNRPRVTRYTNDEQQRLYPGDRGFEFIAQLANKSLPWGVPGAHTS